MIRLITMVALLSMTSVAAKSSSHDLKHFSFRDWKAGDTFTADDQRISACKDTAWGKACLLQNRSLSGIDAKRIGVAFGRNGLFTLEIRFASSSLPVIEAALEEKYGQPCSSKSKSVANPLRGAFTMVQKTWCFSDGLATLTPFDGSMSEASFRFGTYDADKQAAVADF